MCTCDLNVQLITATAYWIYACHNNQASVPAPTILTYIKP